MTGWLRRQRALADYTLAALARRRVKNAGLLLIYALVVFIVASATLFSSAIRKEAEIVLAEAPELIIQDLVMGRHAMISGELVEELVGIRGVSGVKGRLWGYFYDRVNGANYTLMVPLDETLVPARGEAIFGEALPRTRGLNWDKAPLFLSRFPGDLFRLNPAGRLESDSALVSADLILIGEEDFRSFFELPEGVYTDIAVSIRNSREIGTIVEKAGRLLPHARLITRDEISRTYQKLFSWREGIMVVLAGACVLAFAVFAAEKASGLSAEETREIGILKAIGWDTGDVIAMKLWEGGLISIGAFLLGTVLAYLHVFAFDAALFASVLKGWSVIYPDFALTPMIDGLQLSALFFLTVLPYTAATIVPIWRAATADPDQVMR
ncbi:FtsX-like permease family protein [Tropicimonas sp. TH_r6]|uniref:ABC transporter permease n=1 Tax=Tropicimonas sp. TH_r6 TaxID=3082085 RepID=UPI002954E278|nr:FtsX-like permease family protein [Tropicimonas sp. TH_r6]MDV7145213.1 FtsX-like permease family protein [Tropicimonas sp. TH_r6]